MAITEADIQTRLRALIDPNTGKDFVSGKAVKKIQVGAGDVVVDIQLGYPAKTQHDHLRKMIADDVAKLTAQLPNPPRVTVNMSQKITSHSVQRGVKLIPGVKNIIAVASGKGGVGKSTVSVNLAVALAQAGASVGLLDGDITGPNIPLMMGIEGQPKASANNKITPLERYGVKTISIQFFVPEGQPIVWRGPLVGGAIQQFLRDVEWGELDYLVIDLPPGTSDAQLTLAQAVPISGAVLVTTPQEVSLSDVTKALAMFQRMSVPVLGVVENMTAFACPHCGELTEIFGRGGGERFAAKHGLEYLGGVPLDITVRQGGDVGVPAVAQREPGPAARALTAVAQTVAARMSVRAATAETRPLISIS